MHAQVHQSIPGEQIDRKRIFEAKPCWHPAVDDSRPMLICPAALESWREIPATDSKIPGPRPLGPFGKLGSSSPGLSSSPSDRRATRQATRPSKFPKEHSLGRLHG